MKRIWLIPALFLLAVKSPAQNSFASKAFYDAFKRIYADGQTGFPLTKGKQIPEAAIFYDYYKVNSLLPGADSGRLAWPQSLGYPLATYYFTAGKSPAQARAKESQLHTALKTAWGSPLSEVNRNDTAGNLVYYRTYFYRDRAAASVSFSEFDTYLVSVNGSYQLVVNINGRNAAGISQPAVITPKATAPKPAEPELETKVRSILASMDQRFADEKAEQTEQNEYYTLYRSRIELYGKKSVLKDRKFEISFRFELGSESLISPDDAKAIYDKLIALFTASNRFRFKPETKEGSRTYIFASENTAGNKVSRYSLVVEYYNTPGLASVSFLITRQKNF